MTDLDADWAAVRVDYEAQVLSVAALLEKHAISQSALYKRIKRQGWPRRVPGKPVSRATLVKRLYRVLETQILRLEAEIGVAGDKEVALLGALTRNLEKLMEMDRKERGEAAKTPRRQSDITELRAKLARRIDELRGR